MGSLRGPCGRQEGGGGELHKEETHRRVFLLNSIIRGLCVQGAKDATGNSEAAEGN